MLHLKRASAGSGKTYQLAKIYIKLLLSHKEPGKRRTLRAPGEIPEALKGIMAVTFTVKATAEMKQRIVEKLAALAAADEATPAQYSGIHYLEEFMDEFRVSANEIALLAREALRNLLLHYSDFRVQTIDSFFQSILHTFAYEASLDENFNMELDTDYVAAVGFDAALDAISATKKQPSQNRETLHWLSAMMKKEQNSNRWNVFARGENKNSLYSRLIRETKNLEKEEFQQKREQLDDYFSHLDRPFSEMVAEVDEANLAPWKVLHEERKLAAEALRQELGRAGLDIEEVGNRYPSRVKASLEEFDEEKVLPKKTAKIKSPLKDLKYEPGESLKSGSKNAAFKAAKARNPELGAATLDAIDSAYREWHEKENAMVDAQQQRLGHYITWREYKRMLPQLMVVLEIARKKKEYLETTNTIEISDTAHILSRIIGNDDAPFVYERMGTQLNHYLIDEFQDTSRMQWNNLRPLLDESMSREETNLIIGDAKQSIYRFRNADYRLITQEVENHFPHGVVPYTSDTAPKDNCLENVNYRSNRRVIEFNNYIFGNIAGNEELFSDTIRDIYGGARQGMPRKTEEESLGYAWVLLYPEPDDQTREGSEEIDHISLAEPGFRDLPARILELMARGYAQREIGILVRKHSQGQAAVRAISLHNAAHPENTIDVISEEDLLVASALSVRLAVHALELMVQGVRSKVPDNDVLDEPIDESRLFALLNSLQSMALPSVVEAVLDEFVPRERRDRDAPFIAAFQDAVLDYCAGHTSDVGSFLKWWKRKAKSLSITSPEESDGVRIQTIHKAKGLEYPCVIVPKADLSYVPSSLLKEWKWIVPSETVEKSSLLPPYLPVETTQALAETAHLPLWNSYCEEVALDELNKLYVTFTRAGNELYVYAPVKKKPEATTAGLLADLLTSDRCAPLRDGELSQPVEVEELPEDAGTEIRYGSPLTPEQVAARKKEEITFAEVLKDYPVSHTSKLVRFEDGNKLLQKPVNLGEMGDDEELDPRAEGTLKHRVMQMVETPSDLHKALREMSVGGLVSQKQVEEWGRELSEAIERESPRRWFAEDVRVLNERTLLRKGEKYHRPDRVVVTPEGKAVVIDYKFGERRNKHREQVKDYADRLAATGRFRRVEAFLWYVSQNKVEQVL